MEENRNDYGGLEKPCSLFACAHALLRVNLGLGVGGYPAIAPSVSRRTYTPSASMSLHTCPSARPSLRRCTSIATLPPRHVTPEKTLRAAAPPQPGPTPRRALASGRNRGRAERCTPRVHPTSPLNYCSSNLASPAREDRRAPSGTTERGKERRTPKGGTHWSARTRVGQGLVGRTGGTVPWRWRIDPAPTE